MALPLIPLASVVAGPRASIENKGVNELYTGFVDAEDGRHSCYIKVLPEKQLVNELVAWVLARAMKFPVLDGFLLRVRAEDIPHSKLLQNVSGDALAFGLKETNYQQLRRAFNEHPDWGINFLQPDNFPHWQELIVFDDWIANADRHEGNLLLAPGNEIVWIDHSHAFTGAEWDCTTWNSSAPRNNKVATALLPLLALKEKESLNTKAANLALLIDKLPLQDLQNAARITTFLQTAEREALVQFVIDRPQHLERICAQRVGIPTTLRLV